MNGDKDGFRRWVGKLWASPALIDGLLGYAVAMAVGVAVFTSSVGSQPWPAYVLHSVSV